MRVWWYLHDAHIDDSGFRYGFTSKFVTNNYGRRAVDDDGDQNGERREEGDHKAGDDRNGDGDGESDGPGRRGAKPPP
ncbi:hypothetical protein BHYA_0078g00420 [Botrytis hyacinthi]|uniref:Uncharacterized protein n=1 Tax=Botrytis hyacinthi TaxID=278943 RepID=A0A4Z1GRU5_9HELO|nr:hypothetical protein BHYA_0078g00420 [Botrytis hyacinthi]